MIKNKSGKAAQRDFNIAEKQKITNETRASKTNKTQRLCSTTLLPSPNLDLSTTLGFSQFCPIGSFTSGAMRLPITTTRDNNP